MIKLILRIGVLYYLTVLIMFFSLGSISTDNYELGDPKRWLVLIVGCLFLIDVLFIWVYSFYHWGVSSFHSSSTKKVWFWVIGVGGLFYLLGPLAYYVVVYEMKKSLVVCEAK